MTNRIIEKWQIYCNTESQKIIGYKTKDGISPQTCFNNNTHSIDISKNNLIERIPDNTYDLYEWNVLCDTEKTHVIGFTNSSHYPEICFNNNTHIVSSIPELVSKISNINVGIVEESTPTGGNYKSVSYKCDCVSGESIHDYTFDYPISALSISFNSHSENQNDTLEVIVAPETIIGSITSDITASDTIINASSTVIENAQLGYYIHVSDGINSDNLGTITNIDSVNSRITVKTPATNGFLASSPSYIKMSVKVIDNFTFGYQGRYVLGDSKIGGSYIPTNTIIRVIYTNNGNTTKYFYPVIDYLY
ncbi:hypothetical protein SAGO17_0008 [Mimivirus AB-566-O17]|uniref:Uncharacterized protein n=1 Tax=Mimivirus AB-566-O17 TaxID=1988039 RepID=A0A1X9VNN4_9VIRU|nr:hypothetical protein SAGO17_0008 [Mimivirus AB-566-O17]